MRKSGPLRIDDISRESLKVSRNLLKINSEFVQEKFVEKDLVEEDLVEEKLVEEQFFSQKNSVDEELVEEDFKEKEQTYNFTDCFSCQDKALCRG